MLSIIEKIRIPQEKHLQEHMESALNAPLISELFRYKDRYRDDDHDLRNREAKAAMFPVMKKGGGTLYRLCREVQRDLGIPHLRVDYFLSNDTDANATARFSYFSDTAHRIVLNSGLLHGISEKEIRFVIGHELAHLVYGHGLFWRIRNLVYPDFDGMPRFLRGTYDLWRKLGEVSCDRVAMVACGDVEEGMKAQFRLYAGVDMSQFQIGTLNFANTIRDLVDEIPGSTGAGYNTHPISPLRIKALIDFSCSSTWKAIAAGNPLPANDRKLAAWTEEISNRMATAARTGVEHASFDFLIAAGYKIIIADGKASADEYICFLNLLSGYTYWPKDKIDKILKRGKGVSDLLNRSSRFLAKKHPDVARELMWHLIELMLSDKRFNKKELEMLFWLAEKRLKIPHAEVVDAMLKGIETRYAPMMAFTAEIGL